MWAANRPETSIDLRPVLDRTAAVFEHLDKQIEGDAATDEQMSQVTDILEETLNRPPKIYDAPIGVNLLEDATFEGYRDENGDSNKDSGDKRIFTIEIDAENQRLIATDESGRGTDLRGAAMGFLAGAIIGNLLGRQRAAGIGRGHFNNRNVQPRSSYSRARSSARSGSFSSGK